jgi:hypothetical protein
MTLRKRTHKSHHSFLAFGRARHGIQIGETVPESERFEGADVGHKVDSTAMGWLKRSIDGFWENKQNEREQKVERPLPSDWGAGLCHRKALKPARADHVHLVVEAKSVDGKAAKIFLVDCGQPHLF